MARLAALIGVGQGDRGVAMPAHIHNRDEAVRQETCDRHAARQGFKTGHCSVSRSMTHPFVSA
jgi:hypothetical protein